MNWQILARILFWLLFCGVVSLLLKVCFEEREKADDFNDY